MTAKVLRSKVVRGDYGVPLVAYDGTSGGLSGDRTSLVLGAYGPLPGRSGTTRFVVLDTKTLATRRAIVLDGSWSLDAVSPTASTLYLTEHLRAGDKPLYRVRTYDARCRRLRGAIVDRLEGEEEMGGQPVARASSTGGRWAYTLYARRGDYAVRARARHGEARGVLHRPAAAPRVRKAMGAEPRARVAGGSLPCATAAARSPPSTRPPGR